MASGSSVQSKLPAATSAAFTAAGDADGCVDLYRAAAPATCGLAMDVPEIVLYPPPRHVDSTHTPGAAMSTSGPKLEKNANVSSVPIASYPAGLTVATGGPGNWTLVRCGSGAVAWPVSAGQTYALVAFDPQEDGSGNGGVLNITIDVVPPPPTIGVTANPTATFNTKTGAATVSGSVTCSGAADFAFLEVQLSQSVGRFIIRGFGGTDVTCDGIARPWSLQVLGDNGKFAGGKALSVRFATASGAFDCRVDFQERIIQLKGGKR